MEKRAILLLGALTLIGSGVELVRLHKGNPLLRGLNLMGKAILVGGLASAALFIGSWFRIAQPIGTLLILVAFSLCHWALGQLSNRQQELPFIAKALISSQTLATLLDMAGILSMKASVVIFSLALAIEMAAVYRTVLTGFVLEDGSSTRFVAHLFQFLVSLDLARAVATASGVTAVRNLQYWSDTVTYGLFIASGVGLGFGFFSMTTSRLTGELERLAATDPLTQVSNRRAFLMRCATESDRALREGTKPSLLLLDLDHFKVLNDNFGHEAGDEALRASVERVQNGIRGIDTICRWGGEEFAVLLPNADPKAAELVAERIRMSFAELYQADARKDHWRSKPLTVSIGTATWRPGEESLERALKRADFALYTGKRAGRNRTVVHETIPSSDLKGLPAGVSREGGDYDPTTISLLDGRVTAT